MYASRIISGTTFLYKLSLCLCLGPVQCLFQAPRHSCCSMPNPLVNIKWLWLTYSQWPNCPSVQEFGTSFDALAQHNGATYFTAVAREDHPNSGGQHIHCLVHYPERLRRRVSGHVADLYILGGIRPQAVLIAGKTTAERRHIISVHRYVHKVTDHECTGHPEVHCDIAEFIPDAPESQRQRLATAISSSQSQEELWSNILSVDPVYAVQHSSQIDYFAERHFKRRRSDNWDPTYPAESFDNVPDILNKWVADNLVSGQCWDSSP